MPVTQKVRRRKYTVCDRPCQWLLRKGDEQLLKEENIQKRFREMDRLKTNNNDNMNLVGGENTKKEKALYLPYMKGVYEKIERTCRSSNNKEYHIRAAFKPVRTVQHMLTKVKSNVSNNDKKGVRYHVGIMNMCMLVKPRGLSSDALQNTNKQ